MKNVLFLYGINGVGKSTLASLITDSVRGSKQVSGSTVLREALGRVSREELEVMPAERKRVILRDGLLNFFGRHRGAPLIACDTHLIVPIRDANTVTYEQMWDAAYIDYGLMFCNVVAAAEGVLRRRLEDERLTGRKRNADISAVTADLKANDDSFRGLSRQVPNAFVVSNTGLPERAAARLLKHVWEVKRAA